jgi:hypothetical protein
MRRRSGIVVPQCGEILGAASVACRRKVMPVELANSSRLPVVREG